MARFKIDEAIQHETPCLNCGGTENLVTFDYAGHYETYCAKCMSEMYQNKEGKADD